MRRYLRVIDLAMARGAARKARENAESEEVDFRPFDYSAASRRPHTHELTEGERAALREAYERSLRGLGMGIDERGRYWVLPGTYDLEGRMSQLERQRARRDALVKREMLQREIEQSSATPDQKAFMAQHLAHLWRHADLAMGGEETRP